MSKKDPNSTDGNEELDALRKRVNELEHAAEAAERDDGGVTKRGFVKAAWAAPVIMSVNLPNAVFAAPAMSPVSTPAPGTTAAPSGAPTDAPPTAVPGTAAPTPMPVPTASPTESPTPSPAI